MTRKTVDPMAFTQPIERPALTPANTRVLDAIVWWKIERGESPTVGELATLLKCSRTAIAWHERKLVAAGVIELDTRSGPARRTVTVKR